MSHDEEGTVPAPSDSLGASTPNSSTRDGTEVSQTWPRVAKIAAFVVPGTIVVSLFYYFGLVYTHALYRQIGLSGPGLDFTTNDYIRRSLNVVVEPIRLVVGAAFFCWAVHLLVQFTLRWLDNKPEHRKGVRMGLAVLFIVGGSVLMLRFQMPTEAGTAMWIDAAWWLGGLLTVLYGIHLVWFNRHPSEDPTAVQVAFRRGAPIAVVATLLAGVLVAHGLFEVTRFYAHDRAFKQARLNEEGCFNYPEVRLYSTVDLHLDTLGVLHTDLGGDEGSYRHQYSGMRLFIHDNGRYVLWPIERSPRSGAFILPETDSLWVEYLPQVLTPEEREKLGGTCPSLAQGDSNQE